MAIQDKIREIGAKFAEAIANTETGKKLYELKMKFQSDMKEIMGAMKELPKEERPAFGKTVNEFKQSMENRFEEQSSVVRQKELEKKYEAEKIDVTMPGRKYAPGALHPVTVVKNMLYQQLPYHNTSAFP